MHDQTGIITDVKYLPEREARCTSIREKINYLFCLEKDSLRFVDVQRIERIILKWLIKF